MCQRCSWHLFYSQTLYHLLVLGTIFCGVYILHGLVSLRVKQGINWKVVVFFCETLVTISLDSLLLPLFVLCFLLLKTLSLLLQICFHHHVPKEKVSSLWTLEYHHSHSHCHFCHHWITNTIMRGNDGFMIHLVLK